jgi:hypothetical protein
MGALAAWFLTAMSLAVAAAGWTQFRTGPKNNAVVAATLDAIRTARDP